MGPAAQVGEAAVGVEGDGTVLETSDEVALVLVAFLSIGVHGLGLGYFLAYEMLFLAGQLYHLVLDLLEVRVGDGPVPQIHVIVESVLDRRSDTELDAGVKEFQCLGHKVGRRVPERGLGLLILPFMQLELTALIKGKLKVYYLSVERCRKHLACETRRYLLRDLIRSDTLFIASDAAVRKCYIYHNRINCFLI